MKRSVSGFTLVELMIVVAILAILSAIAVPAYGRYVERARRAQAAGVISDMQLRLERWRADNPTYNVANGAAGFGAFPDTENYTVTLTNATATGYTLTAVGREAQANDDTCSSVSVTMAAGTTTKASGQEECWK